MCIDNASQVGLGDCFGITHDFEQGEIRPRVRPWQVIEAQIHRGRRQVHAHQQRIVASTATGAFYRVAKSLVIVFTNVIDDESTAVKLYRTRCYEYQYLFENQLLLQRDLHAICI